jgi:uncharacterized protein YjbI with pentapeptide repeats
MGFSGLLLHGINALIGKKAGKKSLIVDELSKGMIAAALVKSFASLSKWSSENEALAGYQYTPAMNGAGFNGYIHSNPSLKAGSSDFSGADFQGADFQGADFQGKHHDSVGGADFDGYVQTMGDDDSEDDQRHGNDSTHGDW